MPEAHSRYSLLNATTLRILTSILAGHSPLIAPPLLWPCGRPEGYSRAIPISPSIMDPKDEGSARCAHG